MKPYRYLRDPFFLVCLVSYFVNRWLVKPYWPNPFSQFYFNDVICLPFWIPIMLWAMRKVGWRRNDRPPHSYEVLVPLLVWSWFFELVIPASGPLRGVAFGDYLDILCYAAGALAGAVYWGLWYGVYPDEVYNHESHERHETS